MKTGRYRQWYVGYQREGGGRMVTEEDLTLDGGHMTQCTDDVFFGTLYT